MTVLPARQLDPGVMLVKAVCKLPLICWMPHTVYVTAL